MNNNLLHKRDTIQTSFNYWRRVRRLINYDINRLLEYNPNINLDELIEAIPTSVDYAQLILARRMFDKLEDQISVKRTKTK